MFLAFWEVFGRDVNPVFGSYPSAIAEAFVALARSGKLWTALFQSLQPFVIGYLLIAMYKKLQRRTGVVNSYVSSFIIYALSAIVLYGCRLLFKDASDAAVYVAYIGFIIVLPLSAMQTIGSPL